MSFRTATVRYYSSVQAKGRFFKPSQLRFECFRTADIQSLRYKQAMTRRSRCFYVLFAGLLRAVPLPGAQQAAVQNSTIRVRVVEGDGAINSIRLRHAHDPAVQVLDAEENPVAGATVTFLLPAMGAGGTFQDSGLSLTIESDAHGMAAARGLRPNRAAGPFRIRVVASWHGESANATLTETNAEPVASSGKSKKIAIAVLVGGAAAAGAALAARSGKSSSASPSGAAATTGGAAAGATIVAGAPSFGPPH